MSLTKFEKDMGVIAVLDDEPNDVGGLSAQELKEKFDEGGQAVKRFLNETLVPEIEEQMATKAELDGLAAGVFPDLTAAENALAAL